ncbi:MAG: exodeoxyribonuclease VII large subunit, partial [Pyrinomonadaceae bacterium]
ARYRLLTERARVQEAAMSQGFDEVRMRLRVAREELDDVRCRLENHGGDVSRAARRRLDAVRGRLSPAGMAASASRTRVRLAVGGAALESAARARLDDARRRLGLAVASLDAMSPLAVLGRGYALATDERGRVLRSARAVSAGETVRVRLAEGSLRCRVEGAEGPSEN